jgi:DNA-binding beta-propeller fold protein YncE
MARFTLVGIFRSREHRRGGSRTGTFRGSGLRVVSAWFKKIAGWKYALQLLVLVVASAFPAHAEDVKTLRLDASIPLPGFSGDFDHFAFDAQGGRIFLAGEDHKTVEVFDVKTNKRLKSIEGFGAPHAIFYLPESDRILVTDGDKGVLRILSGKDYSEIGKVQGLVGADSARLDDVAQTLYIVTGGKDVPLDYSFIVAIDLTKNAKVGELRIDSNHVEGIALDRSSSRLFANLTDKHAVLVMDRKAMREIARWPIGSQADNSPITYDEAHRRLLIVCRKPGTLLAMDADSGKVVSSLRGPERSDDMAFDAATSRIYVPGGDGHIFVYKQDSADKYELLASVTSTPGAKTCLLVPALSRFYAAVSPGETKAVAKVLVFSVLP